MRSRSRRHCVPFVFHRELPPPHQYLLPIHNLVERKNYNFQTDKKGHGREITKSKEMTPW